jgi:hypothetical protein
MMMAFLSGYATYHRPVKSMKTLPILFLLLLTLPTQIIGQQQTIDNGYEKGLLVDGYKQGVWEYYDNGELKLKVDYTDCCLKCRPDKSRMLYFICGFKHTTCPRGIIPRDRHYRRKQCGIKNLNWYYSPANFLEEITIAALSQVQIIRME